MFRKRYDCSVVLWSVVSYMVMPFRLTPTDARPIRRVTTARGRPSRLTPELAARVAELVSTGVWLAHAARAIGVAPSTVHRWRSVGSTSDAPEHYAAFATALENARLVACRRWLDGAPRPRHPKGLHRLLARFHPARFPLPVKRVCSTADR